MDAMYPLKALALSHAGAAAVRCIVEAPSGQLRDCQVLAEVPEGEGFGAAALSLARRFSLDVVKSEGASDGAFVLVLPSFRSPGGAGQDYDLKLKPGEAAFIATIAPSPAPKGVALFRCPSEAAPARQCQAHPVMWEEAPDWSKAEAFIESLEETSGVALMECRIATDRRLTNCRVDGASARDEASLLDYARGFKAAEISGDILPSTGQQVILRLDWSLLSKLRGLGIAMERARSEQPRGKRPTG